MEGDEITVRVVKQQQEEEEEERVGREEEGEAMHEVGRHHSADQSSTSMYGSPEGHQREAVLRELLGCRCYSLLQLHKDPRLCAAKQAIRQLQLLHDWKICSQPEPHPGVGAGSGVGSGDEIWGYDVLCCGDGGRVELVDHDGGKIHPMVTGTNHQYDRKEKNNSAEEAVLHRVIQTVRWLERVPKADDGTTLWTGGAARVPLRNEHLRHQKRERAAAAAEYEAVLLEQCAQWRRAEKANSLGRTLLGGTGAAGATKGGVSRTVSGRIVRSSAIKRGGGAAAKHRAPLDQAVLHYQRAVQLGLKFVRIQRTQGLHKAGHCAGQQQRLLSRARVAVGMNNAAFLLRLGVMCAEFPRLVAIAGVRCEFFADPRSIEEVLVALRDPSNSHVLRHLVHPKIGPVDGEEWLQTPSRAGT
jgi:hypothetical protein